MLRTITRNALTARSLSSQASISAAPGPVSSAGGSSSFQHPRAQLEKNEPESSINTSTSSTSSTSSSTQPSSQETKDISILVKDPGPDVYIQHITPFHTYNFFTALEKTFPTPVARTLMRSTRNLLVDRISKVQRDALDAKDLDNRAYLFRAALSELRTEATLRTKNQSAAITTAITSLRRDVDRLDVKMKEDITDLKHEIQMEMDNHRNESRGDMKRADIRMEDVFHRSTVVAGDIRTEIEQAKWDNTRRGVAIFGAFVILTIIALELRPTLKQQYPPKGSVDAADSIGNDPISSTT